MPATDHTVTLLTRSGCQLCAEAERTLRRLATEWGFGYREVDIDTPGDAGATLRAEYADRIPVIMIDGREHGYWRVEENRLRRAIER